MPITNQEKRVLGRVWDSPKLILPQREEKKKEEEKRTQKMAISADAGQIMVPPTFLAREKVSLSLFSLLYLFSLSWVPAINRNL